MNETVEITRYPNRRMYDRSQKKYVRVGDIEDLVLAGKVVCVKDSKTGEDLTHLVLTQIILERHPERMQLLPVQFLHAMLRADQLALDWLRAYFAFAQAMSASGTAPPPEAGGNPFASGMEVWRAFMPGGADAPADPGVNDDPSDEPG